MTLNSCLPQSQHSVEIQANLDHWHRKPVLRETYEGFYRSIIASLSKTEGKTLELGSGIGNLKTYFPDAITSDLFDHPWIDRVENAYQLNFSDSSLANIVMIDVFHHLEFPGAALNECLRVLKPGGRLVIFEPALSLVGLIVYGLFHHEPLGLGKKIKWYPPAGFSPNHCQYYAAQGNCSKLLKRQYRDFWEQDWNFISCRRSGELAYLLTGGYSKPQLLPSPVLSWIRKRQWILDYLPWVFASRMLFVLEKPRETQ